ncbi:60S ribosomal protein L31 [archaeon]|nr:MAG: 60S ribosomal protein L31 [archaeon]
MCRDVRVDAALNKLVWSQGIKNIPKRIRVRLYRKRNEDEDAKEKVSLWLGYYACEFLLLTIPTHLSLAIHSGDCPGG